jgi:hypothetical protein
MMRREIVAVSLLLGTSITLMVSAPAEAQQVCSAEKAKKRGFGRLMTGLKGSIGGALRGDGNLASDLAGTAQASVEAAAACVPPDASEARSSRPAARQSEGSVAAAPKPAVAAARYPSQAITIPQHWKAAKEAYDEFGKVRCTGCEGGYAYSGWPSWPRDEFDGKYGGSETRLSRLPVGHVHRWTANGFSGSLTVNAEEEHEGFKCRRMTYRLEKDGRDAERPSLMCFGHQNQFASKESWVGVF